MTEPATRLRQAAAKLREMAAVADHDVKTEPFWACYDPATAWRDGLVNSFGGVTGDYAALMHPGVGAALADVLEVEADVVDDMARQSPDLTGEQLTGLAHGLLALADAILGEATP